MKKVFFLTAVLSFSLLFISSVFSQFPQDKFLLGAMDIAYANNCESENLIKLL